ncbi:microsomal signal peptidase [Peniophora sp. CONT]|nr:microsomal signal peptidase [Peniophora sp. CONT]
MDAINKLIEGKIDFEGQKLAERIYTLALAAITVLAFVVGLAAQDLRLTFAIVAVGSLGVCTVVVPPWPMFNKHPVQWLPKVEEKKSK